MSTKNMSTCATLDDQLLGILLRARKPLTPSEIHQEMEEQRIEATSFETRKAIWNLIGRGLADLTANLQVEAKRAF